MSSSYSDPSDPLPVLSAAPRRGMSGCAIVLIVVLVLGVLGTATCGVALYYGAGKVGELLEQEMASALAVSNDFVAALGRGDVKPAHALCHGAITEVALAAFLTDHAALLRGATGVDPAAVEVPVLGKMRGEWKQHNNDTYVLLNAGPLVGGPAGELTLYLHKGSATSPYRVYWLSLRVDGQERGVGNQGMAPRQ